MDEGRGSTFSDAGFSYLKVELEKGRDRNDGRRTKKQETKQTKRKKSRNGGYQNGFTEGGEGALSGNTTYPNTDVLKKEGSKATIRR